jgi:hypothetical protein
MPLSHARCFTTVIAALLLAGCGAQGTAPSTPAAATPSASVTTPPPAPLNERLTWSDPDAVCRAIDVAPVRKAFPPPVPDDLLLRYATMGDKIITCTFARDKTSGQDELHVLFQRNDSPEAAAALAKKDAEGGWTVGKQGPARSEGVYNIRVFGRPDSLSESTIDDLHNHLAEASVKVARELAGPTSSVATPQPGPTSSLATPQLKPPATVDLAKIDLCRWMDMSLEVSMATGGWPILSLRERSINDPLTRYKITGAKRPSKITQGSNADPDRVAGQALYTALECSYTFEKGEGFIGLDVKLVNGPWLQPSDDFFAENPDRVFHYGPVGPDSREYHGYGNGVTFLKVRLGDDLWLSFEVPSHIEAATVNYRDALVPVAQGMLYTWDPRTRQPIPENQTGE